MEPLKVEVKSEVVCPEGYDFVRDGRASIGDLTSHSGQWIPVRGIDGVATNAAGRWEAWVSHENTDYYIIRRKPEPVVPQGDGVEWIVRGELAECKAKLAECEKKLKLYMDAYKSFGDERVLLLNKIAGLEDKVHQTHSRLDREEYANLKYAQAARAALRVLNEALGLKVTT